MAITRAILRYAVRPRILHRLPGRIRVHMPLLLWLPQSQRGQIAEQANRLNALPGLKRLQVNVISGNALIEYDAERIGGAQVVRIIGLVTEFLVDLGEQLQQTPPGERAEVCKRVCGGLLESIGAAGNDANAKKEAPVERAC